MNTAKSEVRTRLKHARLELTNAERTIKSRAIVEKLKQITDWSQVRNLHYFEPLHELLEPDTSDFITFVEDNYPDLKLFTPRLIEGTWQLIAARGGEAPEKFDVVLVPMLGFDPKSLHRIGYGGGYYDRFLALRSDAKKIGVCFEIGKTNDLPIEPHDIPLDNIITESNVYDG